MGKGQSKIEKDRQSEGTKQTNEVSSQPPTVKDCPLENITPSQVLHGEESDPEARASAQVSQRSEGGPETTTSDDLQASEGGPMASTSALSHKSEEGLNERVSVDQNAEILI